MYSSTHLIYMSMSVFLFAHHFKECMLKSHLTDYFLKMTIFK